MRCWSAQRWAALAYIAEHPKARTTEIADAIRLEARTTIRRLHDLKALGWLNNTTVGTSSAWTWSLTPAGEEAWFSVQGKGRGPAFTVPEHDPNPSQLGQSSWTTSSPPNGREEINALGANASVQPSDNGHPDKEPIDVNFPQKAINSGMTFGEAMDLYLETQEAEGGE